MTPMKKLCLLLLAALAATGCNEDSASEIFSGKDNHIASFALTKDGVTYDAVISQNRITVTVPYNVSLAGATATYELSENAAIQPAPATVTDWESERQFLVTSYNKTDRIYLYSVEYADVVSAGNVTLNTQREVTNFGQTGISVIDGNLAVGTRRSDDPVKTLDGLERLVAVGNNLTIGAAYAGETLTGKGTGLSNLKEVRGNITLSEQNASLKGFSLPSLKSATGDITLVNKALETVEMPVLKRVGGTLEVRSNALILMTADLLTQIDGDMILSGSTSKTAAAPCDYFYFPELKTVSGNLSLSYFDNLSNTGIIFPVLAAAGNITYEALSRANAFTLPEAETLGDISLVSCSAMTEMSLPKLTSAGSVRFTGTTLIRKFECPELVSLAGTLHLDRLVALTGLQAAFPKLVRIDGDLYMSNLSAFEGTLDLSVYTFGPESVVTLQATTLCNLKTIAGPDNFEAGLLINGTGFTPSPKTLPFAFSGFKSIRSFHITGFSADGAIPADRDLRRSHIGELRQQFRPASGNARSDRSPKNAALQKSWPHGQRFGRKFSETQKRWQATRHIHQCREPFSYRPAGIGKGRKRRTRCGKRGGRLCADAYAYGMYGRLFAAATQNGRRQRSLFDVDGCHDESAGHRLPRTHIRNGKSGNRPHEHLLQDLCNHNSRFQPATTSSLRTHREPCCAERFFEVRRRHSAAFRRHVERDGLRVQPDMARYERR